jgi:hypothetical protein
MHRKFLLGCFLAAVSFRSAAFDLGAGMKGGMGMTLLTGTYGNEQSFTAFGFAGAYLEVGFSKAFALQPEFYARTNKFKYYEELDIKESFSWLSFDLDIMLKGRFNFFYIMLGPTFHFGVGDVKISRKDEDDTDVFYDNSAFNQPLIGLALELGLELPLGAGFFITGLKTQWSLTDLDSTAAVTTKLHAPLALQLGYGFRV